MNKALIFAGIAVVTTNSLATQCKKIMAKCRTLSIMFKSDN
jgi:biopolymer transport protein ExbB/TolQ